MSAPSSPSRQESPSPFDALPHNIAASGILSFITSTDWLNFRLASRACFQIVHGADCDDGKRGISATADVNSSVTTASIDEDSESCESLWRLALVRDYMFDSDEADGDDDILHQCFRSPVEPQRDGDAFLSTADRFTASNSFISWKHWRKLDLRLHSFSYRNGRKIQASEKLVAPYFLRASSLWQKIEQWCDDENRSRSLGSEIKSTLLPGRSLDEDLQEGHIEIDDSIHASALKATYAFYAGQCDLSHRSNPFTGLFGGFQAYHIISSSRWSEPSFARNYIIIARGEMNLTVMELNTGQVYYIPQGGRTRRLLATPVSGEICQRRVVNGGIQEEIITTSIDSKDSILRWFEEHANRLYQGYYSVSNIISNVPGTPNGGRTLLSILRYPALSDTANCSRAVTRGVEVVASALFVPEMEMFVYSIRLRLLAPDDEGYLSAEARGFESCQLLSRHWSISKISPNSNVIEVEEVRGEGVIGLYPLLYEGRYINYEDGGETETDHGSGYFSYQSCTQANQPGSLEGSLQFVPGSVAEPSGDVFNARVAPFPLNFSQFLY